MNDSKLLNTAEMCKFLSISRPSLRDMIDRGMPVYTIGKRRLKRYSPSKCLLWLADQGGDE